MKKLILFVAISLCMGSLAFAQGSPDLGVPDTLIIDSLQVANGTAQVNVQVYFTSDDSVGEYNVPIGWFPRESNVHATLHDQYYYPLVNHWQLAFDTLVLDQGYMRHFGIYDLGEDTLQFPVPIPVVANNQRVHVWTMHLVIPDGLINTWVRLDTLHDVLNGSLYFGSVDGLRGWVPKVKSGGVMIGTVGINDPVNAIPTSFALNQNYPNPFNPQTNIDFSLPKDQNVTLSVYNVLGQNVRTLINGNMQAGIHTVRWDGRNDQGVDVPSGIYFYKMYTPEFTQTNKMLMLR